MGVASLRRAAVCALGGASLLLLAATISHADEEKPAPRAPWSCTRPQVPPLPSEPTARDVRDHGLGTRLRTVQCELDMRRHLEPAGTESCYFGPEYARISNQRYDELRSAHKDDPVELWHALLAEPEDPNLPAIELRVSSKSGPNCKSDYERKLESEADALQKELNFR